LITLVLEHLYLASDGFPDYVTLKGCSSVCRIWRGPSQELLFRSGCLNWLKKDLPQLVEIFEQNPVLRSHVRLIQLPIGVIKGNRGKQYNPEDLIPILSLFPRLYGLSLRTADSDFHTEKAIAAKISESAPSDMTLLPRIVALELDHGCGDSNLPYILLNMWPSIQHLAWLRDCFEYPPPPGPGPNLKLKHLSFELLPRRPQVLPWLFPTNTLQSLHLRLDSDLRGAVQGFLEMYGPHLRSLRMQSLSQSFLRCCPNLKELDIGSMTLAITEETVKYFPESLQHIRVRNVTGDSVSFSTIIWALPNLRVLTLPSDAEPLFRDTDEWFELDDLCRKAGLMVIYEAGGKDLVRFLLKGS
jgi:hypothetical protein